MDYVTRKLDSVNSEMDRVDAAYERGLITERERDEALDEIMNNANREADDRRRRYG